MSEKKPNIIMIMSDDHGAWAIGYENHEIKTPNLDRLCDEGVQFRNFFCTSPVCSPARASVLTGRTPSAHGVQDWIEGGNDKEHPIEYLDGQLCYTDVLDENGYNCLLSGKWHLGASFQPQHSFKEWYTHLKGSGDYYNAPMIRDGELDIREGEYVTDLITDDAINNIDKYCEQDKPFYLSVHYTAPHSPWIDMHPKEFTDMYQDCPFETCPQGTPHPQAVYVYDKELARQCLIGYFAAVSAMDAGIGRILDHLEEKGLAEDTFVIFLADNGFNCGHHGVWGKGCGTLDLNLYDTSCKVPCIVRWPGRIRAGQVSEAMLSQYDIFPTLLEVAGIEWKPGQYQPGSSFLPIIDDRAAEQDKDVVIYDEYGPVRMIHDQRYKYVHRYPYGPHEFYDLEVDPEETFNYIEDPRYQDIITAMRSRLRDWFAKYTDPRVDGVYEPNRGNGQLCRPGIYSGGKLAFDPNRKRNSTQGWSGGK